MLRNLARLLMLAGCLSGSSLPVLASPIDFADVASVPGNPAQRTSFDGLQLAQTDLSLQIPRDDVVTLPVAEAVEMPAVVVPQAPTGSASIRVALLLPQHSDTLGPVADAVRAGFMAAHQLEPANITVNFVETGDAAQDVLTGYLGAVGANDIVVGPLTRSGASAIAQNGTVSRPTIALTQLNSAGDMEMSVPRNMLLMGLSMEDEARQIADLAAVNHGTSKAFAISTNASWQRRAVKAFTTEWRRLGLSSKSMELGMNREFLNAAALVQLKSRIEAEMPSLIFVALDAAQTSQLRLAIGTEIPMIGTSQLNPLAHVQWATANRLPDLEGVRLLDVPWQLQPDHAAVMAYPQLPKDGSQRVSPDLERLYALGIDAYRVALNIAMRKSAFEIDGVTGKLAVRFGQGPSHFERIMQPAIYREGLVQPMDAP